MECIACGMCVDACNNVMDKIGLPHGLIRYDTENNQKNRTEAKSQEKSFKKTLRIARPRTIYYTTILTVIGGLMLYSLLTRPALDINVIHDRNPMFVKLSNGSIRNDYTVKIMNMTHDNKDYSLSVLGIDDAKIKVEGAGTPKASDLTAPADSIAEYRIMVSARGLQSPHTDIKFVLKDNATGKAANHPSVFIKGE